MRTSSFTGSGLSAVSADRSVPCLALREPGLRAGETFGELGGQRAGERVLVGAREAAAAVRVDEQQLVVVEAEGGGAEVGDEQRHALAHALGGRVLLELLALGGEAHAIGRVRAA